MMFFVCVSDYVSKEKGEKNVRIYNNRHICQQDII